jgi:hypothetical protein
MADLHRSKHRQFGSVTNGFLLLGRAPLCRGALSSFFLATEVHVGVGGWWLVVVVVLVVVVAVVVVLTDLGILMEKSLDDPS